MGVVAVLKSLPTLLSHITHTADAIVDQRPDLLLTVDVPDFSMRVARKVRKADPSIPIMHWVAPSVWAWRPGRAQAMAPHVDRLLALLPFEPAAFERLKGPPTFYVGHPLLDSAASIRPDLDEQRLRDNALAPVILVLPGSRRSEIRQVQRQIRIEHADQRDVGEIQSFGDHLRSNEQVQLLRPEIPQRVPQLVLPLHRVRVHPRDSRLWKHFPHDRLHPLGAKAAKFDARVIASRALLRWQPARSTDMANEPVL
jgi:hypothetical protein